MINVTELSTGDGIINIAVSFSLRFAENMLNMSLEVFKIICPLFTELFHFIYFFKHISAS